MLIYFMNSGESTESGLPDYRSKDVDLYDRSPNRPVQFKYFVLATLLNPSFQVEVEITPNSYLVISFYVPYYEKCGEILKPDIFLLENVPKEKFYVR
ncbi:NAD-dependent protein deacylase Sirt4-like [Parasteatoda tepidariorum]|uniref:NAD-dependent protein deacylase Sirt4-like n=1 Tax=Parasteatoda tepidariorum TaxID=114398 RepID=UPI0039BD5A90